MGGRLIVVEGAELKCSLCPGGKSYLTPTTSDDKIEKKRPATVKDYVSGLHVHPFSGECLALKGPCQPETPIPWQDNIFSGLYFSNSLSQDLSPDDTLRCVWGGEINVVASGQSTVMVGAAVGVEASRDEGGGSFWDKMGPVVAFAGVAAAADGPVPLGDAVGGIALLGGSLAVGGAALVKSVSDDDAGGGSDSERDSDYYEETYGDYEYKDRREGKRGPLKGGKRSNRDRDFGFLNDKDFRKWWERNKEGRGDIESREDAKDIYDEWDKAGRPKR